MQTFAVERSLKGITMPDLAAAQQRAIAEASRMSGSGKPVRYIRSTFIPDTGQCTCLFEGSSAEEVETLNRNAGIPFTRVLPAMDLRAPEQVAA